MHVRLIAFDLDGTLLGSDGSISPRTRETLKRAASKGIVLAAASGRPYSALPEALKALPCIRYAITSNGSSIFSLDDGERRFAGDMQPEAVLQVLAIAEKTDYPLEVFIGGTGFSPAGYVRQASDYGVPLRVNDYVRRTRTPVDDIASFIRQHLPRIEGMNMIVPDPAEKARIRQLLAQIPQLYITDSVSYYIEMADGGVSKSAALKHLAAALGIPMSETAAFGDSMNDLDLIRCAGRGVAMANALPALLEAADDFAFSNDEDGVADYIETHFI